MARSSPSLLLSSSAGARFPLAESDVADPDARTSLGGPALRVTCARRSIRPRRKDACRNSHEGASASLLAEDDVDGMKLFWTLSGRDGRGSEGGTKGRFARQLEVERGAEGWKDSRVRGGC